MVGVTFNFGDIAETLSEIQKMTKLIRELVSEIHGAGISWANREIKDNLSKIRDIQYEAAFICTKILGESRAAQAAGKELVIEPTQRAKIGETLKGLAEAVNSFMEIDDIRRFLGRHPNINLGLWEKDFYIFNQMPDPNSQSTNEFLVFIEKIEGYIENIAKGLDEAIKDL